MINQHFTWGEAIDLAAKVSSTLPGNDLHSRTNGASSYWDLNCGFEGAIKLAREGWAEGADVVKKLSSRLFDRVATMVDREYPVYDVEGHGIDVARYLDGEPECWMRMETRVTEGSGRRIYRLVFNMTASAGVSAATMLAKGSAVVALSELLEFAGHGVEITCALINSGVTSQFVRIKDADQPLDINRIAFAIAHPAMFRRLGFSLLEHLDAATRQKLGITSYGGYGRVAEAVKEDRGDIYIGGSVWGEPQWESMEAAEAWVIKSLGEQGIQLDKEAA